jgi:hypothetical protein
LKGVLGVAPDGVPKRNVPKMTEVTFKGDSHEVVPVSGGSEFRKLWGLKRHLLPIVGLTFENWEGVRGGLFETTPAPHILARGEMLSPEKEI